MCIASMITINQPIEAGTLPLCRDSLYCTYLMPIKKTFECIGQGWWVSHNPEENKLMLETTFTDHCLTYQLSLNWWWGQQRGLSFMSQCLYQVLILSLLSLLHPHYELYACVSSSLFPCFVSAYLYKTIQKSPHFWLPIVLLLMYSMLPKCYNQAQTAL